jgi:hypothetical protein
MAVVPENVFDPVVAAGQGYIETRRAQEVLRCRSLSTVRSLWEAGELRAVLVRSPRGGRPQRWWCLDDLLALRDRGVGGSGSTADRWRSRTPGRPGPGMQMTVDRFRGDGWLFVGDAADRLGVSRHVIERADPSSLPFERGPGRYRRYRAEDVDRAGAALKKRVRGHAFTHGRLSVEEAAARLGIRAAGVRELVRVGLVSADRAAYPMELDAASVDAYAAGRVPTGHAVRSELASRRMMTEVGVAKALGVRQQTVSQFRVMGVLVPVEVRRSRHGRSFPLFDPAEVDRFWGTQTTCACEPGCSAPAWAHAPFAAGHQLKVPALVLYRSAMKLIAGRERAGTSPPNKFRSWGELRRGLCSTRSDFVRHTSASPAHRPITRDQFETAARIAYGLAAGRPLPDLADEVGKTRKGLDNRIRSIAERGWLRTCRSCSKL